MKLSSREIRDSDLERIKEIHRQHHSFPFSDPRVNVGSSVVENENGLIIGCGYLRPIVEAIMYLDLGQSPRVKVEALTKMIHDGIFYADKFGMTELHLFAEDENFKKVLRKHFSFTEPKAPALVRTI